MNVGKTTPITDTTYIIYTIGFFLKGLRASCVFCLSVGLFVNVGDNTPITDTMSTAFRYDSLESHCSPDTWLNFQAELGNNTLCEHGPDVLDWLIADLKQNCLLRKNTETKNELVLAQVTVSGKELWGIIRPSLK